MKINRLWQLLMILLVLGLCFSTAACDDDDDDDDDIVDDDDNDNDDTADDDTGDDDTSPEPTDATLESIVEDYATMFATVGESMNEPQYFADSTWQLHFGDGNMYGPSYDLATYVLEGSSFHYDRAIEALDTNQAMVDDAAGSIIGLIQAMSDVEDISMAIMGLLEAQLFDDKPQYVESAEKLIGIVDPLVALFGDYLPPELGEFAGATYGPTAISSMIAMLHLGLALSDPPAEAALDVARAEEVLAHIHALAWSDELGAYRFAPDDDRLMLYPNATMLLAYGRTLLLGGDPAYADRIAAIYEGIQPLRDDAGDHYHSPYSREEAGAIDEDYTTLSSQNYLMIGLWLAYVTTGEQKYLNDIDLILGWIETHLFVDGVIKHHWVNGRCADETDLYDFCSGCNLQTLYIYRMIQLEALVAK